MLVACTILPQLCFRSTFGLFLREELLMLVDLTISGVCVIASRISLRATGSALILDLHISRLLFSSSSFPFSVCLCLAASLLFATGAIGCLTSCSSSFC
ncbi:hypothetical protein GQX74_007710 [Glossina fuscipes]|nr:hypothetical protein GQX74_007710 [Glossina fuscipes]